MAFFDLFRRTKEPPIVEEPPQVVDIATALVERETLLSADEAELRVRMNSFVHTLNERLSALVRELREIDLSSRKEHERLKHVVQENLFFYISHLERLLRELPSEEEGRDLLVSTSKMNQALQTFVKNSGKSFEKSTILIGKELERAQQVMRESVQEFSDLAHAVDAFLVSRTKIERFRDIQREIAAFEEELRTLATSKLGLEKEERRVQLEKMAWEKRREEYLHSEEYENFLAHQEELRVGKEALTKNVFVLKERLNLKALLKYYYGDIQKTQLLRAYADDFLHALTEDTSLSIVPVILHASQKDYHTDFETLRIALSRLHALEKDRGARAKLDEFDRRIESVQSELAGLAGEIEGSIKNTTRIHEKLGLLQNELTYEGTRFLSEAKRSV